MDGAYIKILKILFKIWGSRLWTLRLQIYHLSSYSFRPNFLCQGSERAENVFVPASYNLSRRFSLLTHNQSKISSHLPVLSRSLYQLTTNLLPPHISLFPLCARSVFYPSSFHTISSLSLACYTVSHGGSLCHETHRVAAVGSLMGANYH